MCCFRWSKHGRDQSVLAGWRNSNALCRQRWAETVEVYRQGKGKREHWNFAGKIFCLTRRRVSLLLISWTTARSIFTDFFCKKMGVYLDVLYTSRLRPVSFKMSSIQIRSTAARLEGTAVLAHVADSSGSDLDAVCLRWKWLESVRQDLCARFSKILEKS